MLTVDITNVPANINPQVYIYNSAQAVLKSGYATTEGQNFTLSAELGSAGDYYILVFDYSNNGSSISAYNLRAGFTDFFIKNVTDSPDPFSPNADGQKDTTTINATITATGNWTINIKDSSEALKRTYSGTGAAISNSWDGKDGGGNVAPDGNYTYIIDALRPSTGSIAPTASGTVTVDSTPPTAIITSPNINATVGAIFDILGTALDNKFSNYKVEYGEGAAPTTWNLIKSSSAAVTNGLLASWDSYKVSNGTYTIRLTVTDTAGNITSTQVRVNVDNIAITSVSINPDVINPANSETTTIGYTLDRNANVTIKLYDLDNNLTRTLINSLPRPKGVNSEIWNGKDDAGIIVSDDAYTITIEAQAGAAIGPYQSSGGYTRNWSAVSNFTVTNNFNPYNNELCEIKFNLLANSLFSLGVGQSGNFVSTLWLFLQKPLSATAHTFYWDGRDKQGKILDYYTTGAPLVVAYDCLSLPQNTIIVTGQEPDKIDVSTDPFAIVVSYGEIANINYTLPTAGNVSVSIYKPTNILIKKLLENQAQAAGTYKLTWDGTDSSGKPVSEAADYIVKLELVAGGKTIARSGNISVDFIKR
jgi:flagellar hook assembly protein FlgD